MTDPIAPQPAPTEHVPQYAPPVQPQKKGVPLWVTLVIAAFLVVLVGGVVAAIVIPLVSGGSSVTEPAAPAEPETYTSTAYGFTVDLPGTPEEATTTQMLGGGLSAELTTATLTSASGNYIVSAAKFPAEISFEDQAIETTLDNSVTGMVGAITGAELESSESIDLDGVPARAGVISVAGQPDQLFVVAFSDNIQYVLITSDVDDADHTAFVDSFAFGD